MDPNERKRREFLAEQLRLLGEYAGTEQEIQPLVSWGTTNPLALIKGDLNPEILRAQGHGSVPGMYQPAYPPLAENATHPNIAAIAPVKNAPPPAPPLVHADPTDIGRVGLRFNHRPLPPVYVKGKFSL